MESNNWKFYNRDIRRALELYTSSIMYWDKSFYFLISLLEELNLLDRTIMIITSDHGEDFWEYGQRGHMPSSRPISLLRVPLIVYIPDSSYDVVDEPISIKYIPTTIYKLAKIKLPPILQKLYCSPLPGIDADANIEYLRITSELDHRYLYSYGWYQENIYDKSPGILKPISYIYVTDTENKCSIYTIVSRYGQIFKIKSRMNKITRKNIISSTIKYMLKNIKIYNNFSKLHRRIERIRINLR